MGVGVDALDVERGRPGDPAGGEIARQIEREVHDSKWAIALELAVGVGEGERAACGRVRGAFVNGGAAAAGVETVLDGHRGG